LIINLDDNLDIPPPCPSHAYLSFFSIQIVLKGSFEEAVDFSTWKGKSTRARCYRKYMLALKKAAPPAPHDECELPRRIGTREKETHTVDRYLQKSADSSKKAAVVVRPPAPTKYPYVGRGSAAAAAATSSGAGLSNVSKLKQTSAAAVNPSNKGTASDRGQQLPGESKAERDYRLTRRSLRPTSPTGGGGGGGGGAGSSSNISQVAEGSASVARKSAPLPPPISSSERRRNLLKAMRLFGVR